MARSVLDDMKRRDAAHDRAQLLADMNGYGDDSFRRDEFVAGFMAGWRHDMKYPRNKARAAMMGFYAGREWRNMHGSAKPSKQSTRTGN